MSIRTLFQFREAPYEHTHLYWRVWFRSRGRVWKGGLLRVTLLVAEVLSEESLFGRVLSGEPVQCISLPNQFCWCSSIACSVLHWQGRATTIPSSRFQHLLFRRWGNFSCYPSHQRFSPKDTILIKKVSLPTSESPKSKHSYSRINIVLSRCHLLNNDPSLSNHVKLFHDDDRYFRNWVHAKF